MQDHRRGKGGLQNSKKKAPDAAGIQTILAAGDTKYEGAVYDSSNKIENLGIENAWSNQKIYNRYQRNLSNGSLKTLQEQYSPSLRNLNEQDSPPRDYIGSLQNLNNHHISSFLARKNQAKNLIINEGTHALPSDYLHSNLRNMPFS